MWKSFTTVVKQLKGNEETRRNKLTRQLKPCQLKNLQTYKLKN